MKITHLDELDLSDGQIRVYEAVLELGISSLGKIQEKTGIERRNIYDILNKLIERGFISYTIESGKKTYQCTHPNSLKEHIEEKQKKLALLHAELPKIHEVFTASKPSIRAEIFRGSDAIKTILDEAVDYDSYWIGGNAGLETNTDDDLKRYFHHWMERRAEKGKIMHDLVDHGSHLEGLKPDDIAAHRSLFYKYAQLPKNLSSPMVMIMFKNKVVQVLWSRQSFAFVIESDEIHESFMRYFNHFWKDPW